MPSDNRTQAIRDRHDRCTTFLKRAGATFVDQEFVDAHEDRGVLLSRVARLEAVVEEMVETARQRVEQRQTRVTFDDGVEQSAQAPDNDDGIWARLKGLVAAKRAEDDAPKDR
jgi:hypothetical protein